MHQETKCEIEEFKCSIDFYLKYAIRYHCGLYCTICMLLGTTAVYTSPCSICIRDMLARASYE